MMELTARCLRGTTSSDSFELQIMLLLFWQWLLCLNTPIPEIELDLNAPTSMVKSETMHKAKTSVMLIDGLFVSLRWSRNWEVPTRTAFSTEPCTPAISTILGKGSNVSEGRPEITKIESRGFWPAKFLPTSSGFLDQSRGRFAGVLGHGLGPPWANR